MTNVETIVRAAYATMDPHTGMFPQSDCKGCGRPLNADGMHPAELYAGTFTGLCYRCERGGPYIVDTLPDGAQRISYPPHSPSWRRSREEFWAYADCEHCNGAGRKMISRPLTSGGSYPAHCKPCHARVWAPRKVATIELLESVRDALSTLDTATLSGSDPDPLEACKLALMTAASCELDRYADRPVVWQPRMTDVVAAVEYAPRSIIGTATLRAKRADTIARAFVKALDHAIARKREESC